MWKNMVPKVQCFGPTKPTKHYILCQTMHLFTQMCRDPTCLQSLAYKRVPGT